MITPSETRSIEPRKRDVTRLVAHYNKLAPRYRSLYEGNSRLSRFYRSRQALVCQLLEGIDGGSVLEVGCGPGLTVDCLLRKGLKYRGVDISPGMISVCQETFRDNEHARFSVGDSRNLEFPDGEFDIVVSLGMLEYVPDELQAIDEMARVLRIPGILILSGITKWSPYNVFNRLVCRKLKHWQPACIVHEYHSGREYQDLLRRAKLEVVDVAYFDFTPLGKLMTVLPGRERLQWIGNGFLAKAEKRGT